MRRLVGAEDEAPSPTVAPDDELSLATSQRRTRRYADVGLPPALLEACSDEPLPVGDGRFVGRERQLEQWQAALVRWRDGRGEMQVVTGPPGSGITSLLQQMAGGVAGGEVSHYGALNRRPADEADAVRLLGELLGLAERRESIDALVDDLNSLSPRVFLVDNGHFLVSRMFGSHQAIRVFGGVMLATRQRHLWVLGCQEHAWRRLVYVHQADRDFDVPIETAFFSEAELGRCLAARLDRAGLLPGDAAEGKEKPAALHERPLSGLQKLSGGKCDLATFYFLNSLRVDPEDGQLSSEPLVELDFTVLNRLTFDELFTLTELAAHGPLHCSEHRRLFRTSVEESWLMLERLHQACLLVREEAAGDPADDPAYRITPLFSAQISRRLAIANVLY